MYHTANSEPNLGPGTGAAGGRSHPPRPSDVLRLTGEAGSEPANLLRDRAMSWVPWVPWAQ